MANRATTPTQETLARYGEPEYLGSIVANSTTTNGTTAAPFSATGKGLAGMYLVLQASAACQFRFGVLGSVAAVTTDFTIAANGQWEGWVRDCEDATTIGLAVVGNATVKVYRKK